MFAALDLATGQLFYRFRDRKRWQEFLGVPAAAAGPVPDRAALRGLRQLLPAPSSRQVRDWCADHDVELVFTPSNASWLNWIECEFTALRYFTLDGSDYPSHADQKAAIAGYVRWRNRRTAPKVNFATDSPIRTWTDYPAKAA